MPHWTWRSRVARTSRLSPRWTRCFWPARRRPKKLDFCKLTPGEMLRMVRRIADELGGAPRALPVPIVMIGHSKQVDAHRGLDAFLRSVHTSVPNRIECTNYRDFVHDYFRALRGPSARAASIASGD